MKKKTLFQLSGNFNWKLCRSWCSLNSLNALIQFFNIISFGNEGSQRLKEENIKLNKLRIKSWTFEFESKKMLTRKQFLQLDSLCKTNDNKYRLIRNFIILWIINHRWLLRVYNYFLKTQQNIKIRKTLNHKKCQENSLESQYNWYLS